MRIKRLALEQFRSFEALDLDLDREVTLLFGDNGTGKTALVDALRCALSFVPSPDRASEARASQTPDAERVAPTFADLRLLPTGPDAAWRREQAPRCRITAIVEHVSEAHEIAWSLDKGQAPQPSPGLSRLSRSLARTHEGLPVVAAYRASRRWDDRPGVFTEGRLHAYASALRAGDSLAALRGWWQQADHRRLRGSPEPALDVVELAVQRLFGDEGARPGFDPSPDVGDVVVYVPATRTRVALRELSDGHRGLVALVADLAVRAATLRPDGGAATLDEAKGVVVVDEIDLHLHPRLQREVVPRLREVFPRLQWALTTRSPQVLSSVRSNDEVVRLTPGPAGVVAQTDLPIAGRDTNAILREDMGVPERDPSGEARLRPIYAALDRGDLDEAERQIAALETLWGDLDPELIELRSRVAWAR
ncbi:MAG TPA: AAA family ATPase [Myxococcota bacterium]|nr:AAA family ATPase [Myxococcota bacterium]